MLIAIVILQILLLLATLALLLRRPATASPPAEPDPRQAQVPEQLTRLHERHETNHAALDTNLRAGLSELRREAGVEALSTRESNTRAFAELRTELLGSLATLGQQLGGGLTQFREDNASAETALRGEVLRTLDTLGGTLKAELASFRGDNTEAAAKLHGDARTQYEAARVQHDALTQRLGSAAAEARTDQANARDALHTRLTELDDRAKAHADRLLHTVQERLDALNTSNTAKLEEMRATVDEKLHATLHTRLTESFGQVTDQLNKVHTGLGEMSKLSEGVDGLSRIFTNVKTRGGFAEVQLGALLRQMLAPGQFLENVSVKPGSAERVEYAVRFPSNAGERLLPIDAKFPLDAWERLEAAYESNLPDAIQREGRNFENAIRTEAERICKYINPPATTPYGIMFLPTEGLYAEVIQREALQTDVQARCHVTIAGPTTLSAILTSFQMGFHMLALQEKGDEVWKVLERTKTEFKTFESLMGNMEKQVGTVQNTIQKLGVRTRAINRNLREVSDTDSGENSLLEEFSNVVPMLAADTE